MMIAITAGFRFPSAAQSSHVVMRPVIPNRRINITDGLRRYRGWSAVAVISVPLPLLKWRTRVWPNIYGILTIDTPQTCMNCYGTGAFQSNKFNHLSLPSTYVHKTGHFSLQLCWIQVWLQHRWYRWNWAVSLPVDVERNSAQRHI